MREAVIQKNIIRYLQLRGFKVYKISDRFRAGIPDLYVARNGWSCWIEVKAPGGRLSTLQAHEIDQLRAVGITVLVAHSVEDVKAMLEGAPWQSLQEILREDGAHTTRLPGLVPAPAHAKRVTP